MAKRRTGVPQRQPTEAEQKACAQYTRLLSAVVADLATFTVSVAMGTPRGGFSLLGSKVMLFVAREHAKCPCGACVPLPDFIIEDLEQEIAAAEASVGFGQPRDGRVH